MGKVLMAGKKVKKAVAAAFAVGGGVAKPGLVKAAGAALAVGDAIMKITVVVTDLVKQIKRILAQLDRIESTLNRVEERIESLEKGQMKKRKTARRQARRRSSDTRPS